jgi:hypothetical protein
MDARAETLTQQKYLPVEDLPPKREKPALTVDEQAKLKKELTAARERQETSAKAQGSAAPAKPMKPHAVPPTNQAVACFFGQVLSRISRRSDPGRMTLLRKK